MKKMKRLTCGFLAVLCLLCAMPMLTVHGDDLPREYDLQTSYGSDGKVSGLKVTVAGKTSAESLEIVVEEVLPVTSHIIQAPVLEVSAQWGYKTQLRITMDGPFGGVVAAQQSGNGVVRYHADMNTGELVVTVYGSAVFRLVNEAIWFPDVPADMWARNQIDYMTAHGYITGKLDGTFGAEDAIQRRTVAMLLWRMAGSPEVSGECPFSDVKEDRYYQAILWAYQQGIIKGYTNGTFGSEDIIARQHFIVMLKRYADAAGLELPKEDRGSLTKFHDYESINAQFREAAQWGMDCGLILGRANNVYDPASGTSRAQMAVILSRFLLACDSLNEEDFSDTNRPNETPIV